MTPGKDSQLPGRILALPPIPALAGPASGACMTPGNDSHPPYIVLDRPPIMLDLTDEQLRAEIRERLALREREIAAERKRLGIRVLGWAKAVAQFFLALPGKTEEMFKRKPHFSASHVWERVAMAAMVKKFREVYASCRARFLAGERDVAFPEGTYFMRRHWKVPIEPLVT